MGTGTNHPGFARKLSVSESHRETAAHFNRVHGACGSKCWRYCDSAGKDLWSDLYMCVLCRGLSLCNRHVGLLIVSFYSNCSFDPECCSCREGGS